MALYRYVKNVKNVKKIEPEKRQKIPRWLSRFASFVFLFGGLSLILIVVFPLLSWQLNDLPRFEEKMVKSPIPEALALENQKSFLSEKTDLTLASNWFPNASRKQRPRETKTYSLSIPKLKISEAVVQIGSEDLSKSLIQWGGTSLPGDLGNAVIFGHSTLPVLFNPSDYKTIFAYLPSLTNGDEIFLNFDGISYKYVVFEMKVVSPSESSVLNQDYRDSFLSLITCVPPGTYWKRLVVKAKLEKI